jgi:membrane-associated phospholipid phosphatase
MKRTVARSPALCSGLLMAMALLVGTCFAQSQGQEQQPMGTTRVSASEPGFEAAQSGESKPAFSARNSQGEVDGFTESSLGLSLLKNIALDQEAIWASPRNVRLGDVNWLLPLGAITAALLMADTHVSKAVTAWPSRVSSSSTFSNYGLAALGGAVGGSYLLGQITHDDHKRETGLLSGEAAVDAVAVTTALQYAFGRQKPTGGNGGGGFWHGGTSFPSDHSAAAWAMASVIAHEYPGPLTKLLAYGLAGAVSVSRVTGRNHFPSDVLIGSAIGWFAGQQVYRAHHDPELGGSSWETFSEMRDEGSGRQVGSQGSPYVPLDNWVYPAIERLAARGFVQTGFMGLRPWTRAECAQMVEEAGDVLSQQETEPVEPADLYQALKDEFARDLRLLDGENNSALQVESVYTRATYISGTPLNDSYHFGQTIINDFGRPYGEGANVIAGFSGWASSGRFAVYVRGEYQHAPSVPAYSQSVRDFIAQADYIPVQAARATPTVNQVILLDAYALLNVDNWELSFGKQSLWWGPAEGGALMLSDNAEPIVMFRARRTVSYDLPWIFRRLGPMKAELFVGQLAGNHFPPRPLLHGQKVSFKPTANLELGAVATSEFGGVGRPITTAAIFNSYFSTQSSAQYAADNNPGKRTLGFDFSYKIPHLRDWLTLYDEALLPNDNPTNFDMSRSPIYAPRRAAMRSGLYLSHMPGVPKLDLRVEAVYTDPPTPRSRYGQYVYFNDFYHQLYTNRNNIIGDWIGRQGMGFQGWTTYWFSPRNSLQFGYRHAKIASDFVPGGGTLNDGSVKVDLWLRRDLSLSTCVQYEKWRVPLLAPGPQRTWTSSIEIAFWPHSWSR